MSGPRPSSTLRFPSLRRWLCDPVLGRRQQAQLLLRRLAVADGAGRPCTPPLAARRARAPCLLRRPRRPRRPPVRDGRDGRPRRSDVHQQRRPRRRRRAPAARRPGRARCSARAHRCRRRRARGSAAGDPRRLRRRRPRRSLGVLETVANAARAARLDPARRLRMDRDSSRAAQRGRARLDRQLAGHACAHGRRRRHTSSSA